MTTDPRLDVPRALHRLAVALRFVDAFTDTPVRVPLAVSIPAQAWPARYGGSDATYRFLVTNADLPAGTFAVTVTAPGGEYVNWEPVSVQLPPPGLPHAPPLRASDFLVTRPLWPTPRLRLPPAETAVLGRVVSASAAPVAGLRVALFTPPGPPPAAPYTRTDARGEFLFRFPQLRGSASGGAVVSQAAVAAEVRDASDNPLAVTPAGPQDVPLGKASVLTFGVP
jgi:hypothetical protein